MVQKCIMFYYSTSTAVLLTQNKKWCGGWKKVYFAGVRWFGFLLNLVRLIMTSIALIKTNIRVSVSFVSIFLFSQTGNM